MADLLVRHLERLTLDRLKARARRRGRSLQSEVKLLLERVAAAESLHHALAELRRGREGLGRRFDDSAGLIREDRER
jgi:plasmid stability protein